MILYLYTSAANSSTNLNMVIWQYRWHTLQRSYKYGAKCVTHDWGKQTMGATDMQVLYFCWRITCLFRDTCSPLQKLVELVWLDRRLSVPNFVSQLWRNSTPSWETISRLETLWGILSVGCSMLCSFSSIPTTTSNYHKMLMFQLQCYSLRHLMIIWCENWVVGIEEETTKLGWNVKSVFGAKYAHPLVTLGIRCSYLQLW